MFMRNVKFLVILTRGNFTKPFVLPKARICGSRIKLNGHVEDSEKIQNSPLAYGKSLKNIEVAVLKKFEIIGIKKANTIFIRIVAAIITLVIGVCGYLYLFRHELRDHVAVGVSSVATKSLEDEKIISKAGDLSKEVVNEILNDKQTKKLVSNFLKDVIISAEINQALHTTVTNVFNDSVITDLLHNKVKNILLTIINQDDTRLIVINQIKKILLDESIKTSLQSLIYDVCQTEEVKMNLANLFKDVLSTNEVKLQGTVLAQQVTENVLSNTDIQVQASDALWSTVKLFALPKFWTSPKNTSEE